MKIIPYIILYLIITNVSEAATIAPDTTFSHPRVSVTFENVSLANDSVTVRLFITTRGLQLSRKASVTILPLLTGEGKENTLPAVIIAGKRRARLNAREAALSRVPQQVFRDIRLRDGINDTLHYATTIPYSPWMRDATLSVRYVTSECLADDILGVQTVKHDVSLVDERDLLTDSLRFARETIRQLVVLKERLLDSLSGLQDNTRRGIMYLAYPAGQTPLLPDFKDNRRELARIDSVLRPLLADTTITIRSVTLTGYASPEGNYGHNARLAALRVSNVLKYLCRTYSTIDQSLFRAFSVAEDWEGTVRLLTASDKPYKEEVLKIIRECNIFDGRERHLILLHNGTPYRDMLKNIFPKLRRTEFIVEWEKKKHTTKERGNVKMKESEK